MENVIEERSPEGRPRPVQMEAVPQVRRARDGRRLRLLLINVGLRAVATGSVAFPLGILSLAAYLRERFDLDIKLMDQRITNFTPDEITREAAAFEADVVGFGAITCWAHMLPVLTRKMRLALPKALIVLGGPHVSASGVNVMDGVDADVAVPGEGELALEQILTAHLDGAGFGHIPGLVWRAASGEVTINPGAMPLIQDLDALPFLAYDLIDVREYWRLVALALLPPRPYVALLTSRGCPFRCVYCHNIFGKRFRAQSVERILAEIEHLQRALGVKELEFYDDTFNYDARRVIDFCQSALHRGLELKITFPNALRTDILTSEVVDALADAGLYYTCCALESGSPKIQQYIGKRLNIPRFLEGVEKLAKRRVFTYGYMMLGFPSETEADLQQTIDVASRSRLHGASFFMVIPHPGTELYARVLQSHPEKLAALNYTSSSYQGMRINLTEEPDEVFFRYRRKAYRTFYLDPVRLARIGRCYPRRTYALLHYIPMLIPHLRRTL